MPTVTEVSPKTRVLGPNLSVTLMDTGEELEFELKDEDYLLVQFKNERVFGTRWLLLRKGVTKVPFKDVHQHTELIFHAEKDKKFNIDSVKWGPIKIPPPPGR